MNHSPEGIQILLIEDNPGDVELTREALEESKLLNQLLVARDGTQALTLLRASLENAGNRLPDLVLLDLNLPGISGQEVLAEMKSTPGLARIPVVILTSSQAEIDIAKSYDLHANCYITKPIEFLQFIQVIRSIEDFWFTIVRLPRQEGKNGNPP